MAANHAAILRSSTRLAQHHREEENKDLEESARMDKTKLNEVSNELSVISLSSSEGDEFSHKSNQPRSVSNRNNIRSSTRVSRSPQKLPMAAPLDKIKDVSDIDNCVDQDLHQYAVLERLEQKWFDISTNLNNVLVHLKDCSNQVSNASMCYLEALKDSVDITCDKADDQVNTINELVSKCDELGTKISVASTFCDEIKTLRKSIDTLDNLYKTRPQKPVGS